MKLSLAGLLLVAAAASCAEIEVKPVRRGWLGGMIGGIKDGVGSVVGGVKEGVGQVTGGIKDGVGNVADGIKDGVGNVAGGIKDGVGNVVGGISEGVGDVAGGIKDGVGNVAGGIKDGVGTVTGGIKDGIKEGIDGIKNELEKVTQELKGFLDNLGEKLSCQCSAVSCSCCGDASIAKMNNKFCLVVQLKPLDMAVQMKATWNDNEMFSKQISAKNPGAVCAPLPPPLSLASLCVRPFGLSISVLDSSFKACFQLEGKAFSKVLASINLNCFSISKSGTLKFEKSNDQPDKGYVNLDVGSIASYVPVDLNKPIQLPIPGK